ncbi:hypothetical protein NLU13_5290 [Sarocladium strictum]|uniref:Uncharacterized protein n=1 Tax=Sarocladium strictum TaxID=5046 RepID=A0AA39GGY4_SARSR|nr:hypothetical protein NLU13_5290 [Sarocladium strictum]
MDLLAGWDDSRCEDTIAGRHVFMIGYTLPMIDFIYAFKRADLYLRPDAIVAANLTRVARREADLWIEAVKTELADTCRPMEVLLAATFLMCRQVEAQSDVFAPGDLRRRFYHEVHDALIDHERLSAELRTATESLERQYAELGGRGKDHSE